MSFTWGSSTKELSLSRWKLRIGRKMMPVDKLSSNRPRTRPRLCARKFKLRLRRDFAKLNYIHSWCSRIVRRKSGSALNSSISRNSTSSHLRTIRGRETFRPSRSRSAKFRQIRNSVKRRAQSRMSFKSSVRSCFVNVACKVWTLEPWRKSWKTSGRSTRRSLLRSMTRLSMKRNSMRHNSSEPSSSRKSRRWNKRKWTMKWLWSKI